MRPKSVPLVSVFLFTAAGIALVVGVSLLFPNRLLDRLWELNRPGAELFRRIGPVSGVFLLALSVGSAAAGRGLLRRQRWAWWFATGLFAVDGVGDVISYLVTGDLLRSAVGAAVSSAFLWAMLRRPVRAWFLERPRA